jgi:hypothetical protein
MAVHLNSSPARQASVGGDRVGAVVVDGRASALVAAEENDVREKREKREKPLEHASPSTPTPTPTPNCARTPARVALSLDINDGIGLPPRPAKPRYRQIRMRFNKRQYLNRGGDNPILRLPTPDASMTDMRTDI